MNNINLTKKSQNEFWINNTTSHKEITSLQIILSLKRLFKYKTNILRFSNTKFNTNYFTQNNIKIHHNYLNKQIITKLRIIISEIEREILKHEGGSSSWARHRREKLDFWGDSGAGGRWTADAAGERKEIRPRGGWQHGERRQRLSWRRRRREKQTVRARAEIVGVGDWASRPGRLGSMWVLCWWGPEKTDGDGEVRAVSRHRLDRWWSTTIRDARGRGWNRRWWCLGRWRQRRGVDWARERRRWRSLGAALEVPDWNSPVVIGAAVIDWRWWRTGLFGDGFDGDESLDDVNYDWWSGELRVDCLLWIA